MKILHRYVVREFLKVFAICFFGLLGTYFLVDFFQRIELFMNYPTPLLYKMLYFVLKLPIVVFHVTPIAMLVAVLVTLGMLNRNREITAVKCAGVRLTHLCAPLVVLGVLASAFVFLTNEYVVPYTQRRGRVVYDVHIKNRPLKSLFRQNRVWYYGEDNTIFNVQLLDPAAQMLEGVTLFRFDRSGARLIQRIDARRALYSRDGWWFLAGTIRTFGDDGSIRTERFRRRQFPLSERLQDLSQYREKPEDMNYAALAAYVRKLRRSGFNPTAYLVDLKSKVSLPFVSLIITILAIPFAFRSGPTGGVVASLGASLSLGFVYWIVISIAISLGHAGKVPPVLAAWLPNAFFLLVGGYLWLDMER